MRFELNVQKLRRYFRWNYSIGLVGSMGPFLIVIAMIMILEGAVPSALAFVASVMLGLAALIGSYLFWYARQYVRSLAYRLEDNILYVEEGVFTYQHKAIPLDRVTDIRLVQGLLMRWIGIWQIQVQTASQGMGGAEGTMWAIDSPKAIRRQLLAARHEAVMTHTVDTVV